MVPLSRRIATYRTAVVISAALFALLFLAAPSAAAEMSPEAVEYRRIGLAMPWELSPEIAAILGGLPGDQREKVEREIEMIVHELVNSGLFYNEFVFHFRTSATPLHIAAQDGDVDEARRLLDAGADANAAMKPYGHTPLSLAVGNRNLDVAKLLLERGADPGARLGKQLNGDTPLMLAAKAKNAPMLRLLLEGGAEANLTNENGTAAIRHAAGGGEDYDEGKRLAAVAVLLEHGAVPDHMGPGNGWDSLYSPVLFSAAEWGMLGLAKRLIDAGADIDFTDDEEFTPLLHAIANRRHAAVEFFLDRGAKFEPAARFAKRTIDETSPEIKALLLQRGLFESPPLLRLAAAGDVPGLRALAEGGASLSGPGVLGENALAHAAMNRRPEALRFLLENGVDADARDNSGWTPLFYAARYGDMDVLSPLLAVSTGTWVVDEQGETALHQAAKNGDADMIRALVQAGAEVSRAENGSVAMRFDSVRHEARRMLPLHWAAKYGRLEAVKALVQAGADIDAVDGDGRRPVFYAASERHFDVLAFLVAEGADTGSGVDWRRHRGLLRAAVDRNDMEMLRFCLDRGMAVDARDIYGGTAFADAVRGGRDAAILDLLIESGADVNARDNREATPLHGLASKTVDRFNKSHMRYLLRKGADPAAKNDGGVTPLFIAVIFGNGRAAKLLAENGGGFGLGEP